MPTIQSKKYEDHVSFISIKTWENFKRLGKHRLFKVIDDSDIQATVISTPQAFEPMPLEGMPDPEMGIDSMTKEVIKVWLDEHDVEYDAKARKEELYQLYIDNN